MGGVQQLGKDLGEKKAGFEVRQIRPEDRADWLPLWNAFFAFHGRETSAAVTAMAFKRLCDPAQPVHGLIATDRGGSGLLGFAAYVFHPETLTVGPGCYLRHLFTREDARGRGVGRALILAVYAAAEQAGAERVMWLVREDNAAAVRLYDALATRTGFTQYRRVLSESVPLETPRGMVGAVRTEPTS